MGILDIDSLKTSEKFMMMEELWESLSKDIEAKELTPDWHKSELSDREEKVVNGEATFLDIEIAKENINKLLNNAN